MSTFVLVHGAWHGSWCWKRVRQALQQRGHEVFTPTLTGLGERSHLLSQEVNLETHIEDVVNLIRWEELSDVVLCGHSYGGCVVTGVADRVGGRIASLIYLDAFVPEVGQCLFDLVPAELADAQRKAAREAGDGWKVPPIPAEVFNVNEADRAWVNRQCTMQPIATFEQPLRAATGPSKVSDVTYILANGWAPSPLPSPFPKLFQKAKTRGWKVMEWGCGHDVMLDMPEEVTRVLLAAVPHSAASVRG